MTPTVSTPPIVCVKVEAERYGGSAWVGRSAVTTTVDTPVCTAPPSVTVNVEAERKVGRDCVAIRVKCILESKRSVGTVGVCYGMRL